jgi:hypothetical protein
MLTWALVESPHQRSLGRKHAADGRCQPYVPACLCVPLVSPIILTSNIDIVTVDLHASQVSSTGVAPDRSPC